MGSRNPRIRLQVLLNKGKELGLEMIRLNQHHSLLIDGLLLYDTIKVATNNNKARIYNISCRQPFMNTIGELYQCLIHYDRNGSTVS